LDVKKAFINGDFHEEIYVEQPPISSAQREYSILVCRLYKSLYDLKQSSRTWFDNFNIVIQ